MRLASKPAYTGGVDPYWNECFRFVCEESRYASATLTIEIWHQGKSYHRFIGAVGINPLVNFPLSHEGQAGVTLTEQVVFKGVGRGHLKFSIRVARRTPDQRKIEVSELWAQDLKNVKWLWRRFSFSKPHVRKMSPYVVVSINPSNESSEVSPAVKFGGKHPIFEFDSTFMCDENLLERPGRVTFTVQLYHRHKAEIRPVKSTSDRALDKLIGTATIPLSKSMEKTMHSLDVRTPKDKARGKLFVSVEFGELVRQSRNPLPRRTWEPRIRPPNGLFAAAVDNMFIRATGCMPCVGAAAGVVSATCALAGV